jgi:hypothetical protein
MLRVNLVCWFGFHKFNKDFCLRCGLNREVVALPPAPQPIKGKIQFVSPVTPKERFNQAKNINDLLEHD